MATAGTTIPDSLRTDACPNCAYSLDGLPEVVTCPECGQTFDQSEIILYGWGRGKHENLGNAKGSRAAWLLALSVAWIALVMPSFRGAGLFWPALLVAAVVGTERIVLFFRRQGADHPGLTQVRLSERGCVQYDSVAGPTFITALLRAHGWLLPVIAAMGIFGACACGRIEPVFGWILCPIFLIAATYHWFPCRRFRQALLQVPTGAIANRNVAFHCIIPWTQILQFTLRPSKEKTQRLRIEREHRSIINEYPVDAEIRCTGEQAAELAKWLDQRLTAARRRAGLFSMHQQQSREI